MTSDTPEKQPESPDSNSSAADAAATEDVAPREQTEFVSVSKTVRSVLEPLASMKLTVVLFALSIFIVLAGTLAQAASDMRAAGEEATKAVITEAANRLMPYNQEGVFIVPQEAHLFIARAGT